MSRRPKLSLLAVALVVAGCSRGGGADVDVAALLRGATSTSVAPTDVTTSGASAASNAGAATSSGTGRAAPGTGSGSASDGSTGDTGTGAGASSSETGVAPTPVAMGPGVTGREIKVGFMVTKNLQAAFGAIGASGQPPDEIDLYRAMVAWANANGGFAGRKIVPVFVEVDATTNWQAQAQAACATFADDNRVAVAVSSVVGGTDALVSCLAPKGVPLVEQNHWLWDQPYWNSVGAYLYEPSRMRPERSIPAGVKTLADGGFFASGHRLGLVRFDGPVFQRLADKVMKPALAANGGNLVEEVTISSPGGAGDLGGVAAQLSNAVLRFRAARVTNVVFLENAGILPFFWNHEANSQSYYPRLGLMTYDLPETQAGQVDPKVLKNALAAGWAPALDTVSAQSPPNPARTRCAAIMRERGVPTDYGFGFYHSAACDAVFFLKQALDHAPALTADGMRRAVEALGTSYQSPYTFAQTAFGPGRHDGAAMIALLAYQEAPCDCFVYTTPPHAVP